MDETSQRFIFHNNNNNNNNNYKDKDSLSPPPTMPRLNKNGLKPSDQIVFEKVWQECLKIVEGVQKTLFAKLKQGKTQESGEYDMESIIG